MTDQTQTIVVYGSKIQQAQDEAMYDFFVNSHPEVIVWGIIGLGVAIVGYVAWGVISAMIRNRQNRQRFFS